LGTQTVSVSIEGKDEEFAEVEVVELESPIEASQERVCVNGTNTVVLTATSSGDGFPEDKPKWSAESGSFHAGEDTGEEVTWDPGSTPGKVEITAECGDSEETITITVVDIKSIEPDTDVACVGDTITYTITLSDGGEDLPDGCTITWNVALETDDGLTVTIIVTEDHLGSGFDIEGCINDTTLHQSDPVEVVDVEDVTVSGNVKVVCVGESVTLTATATGGGMFPPKQPEWDDGDAGGTFSPKTGAVVTWTPSKASSSEDDVEIEAKCGKGTPSDPVILTAVKITLVKNGKTTIEPSNDYSENTPLRVTMDPALFGYKAKFVEKKVSGRKRYYFGIFGSTDLTDDSVSIKDIDGSTGIADIVIKSISNSTSINGPDSAEITVDIMDSNGKVICTTPPLSVDQWVDETGAKNFIDWLEQQSKDVLTHFQGLPGEVGTVANTVTSILQNNTTDCGATKPGETIIRISPVCGTPNGHRRNSTFQLSNTVIHEARHAWVQAELKRADNDTDKDFWPEDLSNFKLEVDILDPDDDDSNKPGFTPFGPTGLFETEAAAYGNKHARD